jgi:hypothetical protein
LQHVFVAGDDEDGIGCGRCFAGESANHIVGFITFELQNRDAIGLESASNVGNLLHEVGGHFGAVGLVAVILRFLKGLGFDIKLADGSDRLGLPIADGGRADIEDGGEILGRKSSRNFRSIFTKTKVAAVGTPVLVVMGRCRDMA